MVEQEERGRWEASIKRPLRRGNDGGRAEVGPVFARSEGRQICMGTKGRPHGTPGTTHFHSLSPPSAVSYINTRRSGSGVKLHPGAGEVGVGAAPRPARQQTTAIKGRANSRRPSHRRTSRHEFSRIPTPPQSGGTPQRSASFFSTTSPPRRPAPCATGTLDISPTAGPIAPPALPTPGASSNGGRHRDGGPSAIPTPSLTRPLAAKDSVPCAVHDEPS